MQTSQARAAPAVASTRWKGTSLSRWGMKAHVAAMKVKITFPGGPIRAASHATLCRAASTAATMIRTVVDRVRPAAVSATPTLAIMPSATQSRVRARAAYGRPCAYRAHIAPAEV